MSFFKEQISRMSDMILHKMLRLASFRGGGDGYGHVILAPSSRGNLGDEAMLAASIGKIRELCDEQVTILTHVATDDWSDIAPGAQQVSIDGYFSAAGFLKPLRTLKQVFGSAKSFSILGADVMDGAYSRTRTFRRLGLADLSTSMGVPTRILGFSYSDRHNAQTHAYLRRLSSQLHLYARDKYSFERLRSFSLGDVSLVADTALLLRPADPPGKTARDAIAFAGAARAQGSPVIAFNANPLGSAMSAGAKRGNESVANLDDLVANHVRVLLETHNGLQMIFIPHDPRDPHNDRTLLQKAYDALTPALQARVFPAFGESSARDVKAICGHADLTVTGRMHMGIASLGALTPCLFLDFQGKVRGLLSHFAVEDMVFDWPTYSDSRKFSALVLAMLEEAPHRRETIAKHHGEVIALSTRNFEDFASTLKD